LKRLHLLRHAKSSWKDESLPDEERPLSKRGVRASARMAEHVAETGLVVELVICSSARRARETLGPILQALAAEPEVRVEPRVYGADAAELLEVVRALPEQVATALLVGHNPGIQSLALRLAREGERLARLADKYPTGALATLELEVERWAEVDFEGARLASFVRPRELG
jgi:phosphohistidine phosphatase